MNISVNAPSYKRPDDVRTLSYLPYTKIWVDHKEYEEYKKNGFKMEHLGDYELTLDFDKKDEATGK